ncbi:MAG: hypothetical protein WKF66_18460 [Pedobacter sp.]
MKKARYFVAMLLILSISKARADDPGLPGGDPDVPIDGGIVLLILAGAYYGVKRIRGTKSDLSD